MSFMVCVQMNLFLQFSSELSLSRSYHCQMESNQTNPEQLSKHKIQNCEEWDDGGSSFSASFMSKSQDISFGAGSPTCDAQFPCFGIFFSHPLNAQVFIPRPHLLIALGTRGPDTLASRKPTGGEEYIHQAATLRNYSKQ